MIPLTVPEIRRLLAAQLGSWLRQPSFPSTQDEFAWDDGCQAALQAGN